MKLEDALNEVRSRISKIVVGQGEERLAKAKAELEKRVRRNEATLTSLVGDVLELSALQGGHPFVEHVADELVRHGNLNFVALCRQAIGRANAVRSGQKEAP